MFMALKIFTIFLSKIYIFCLGFKNLLSSNLIMFKVYWQSLNFKC